MAKIKDIAAEMYRHAEEYRAAADCLNEKVADSGWSPNILEILAVEVMLKCVFRLDQKQQPEKNHHYNEIWNGLSQHTRDSILGVARERMAGRADMDKLQQVLAAAERLFVQGRYSYDRLESRSIEQHKRMGREWIEQGALIDEAEYQHLACEVLSLYHGLREWVKTRLA